MVGEIRDRETAENAMQAALTGHLVLSTLHTNDAPGAVVRLLDLGIQPYLIRSTVTGIVAQRLVRRICRHCALPYRLSAEECRVLGLDPEAVGDAPVAIGAGCTRCRGTGYLGRTGVFEVIEVSEAVREATTSETSPEEIERIARREGFTSLREGGIRRLLTGATTFDEVVRVFGIS
jgi:general secretion pathway protein E